MEQKGLFHSGKRRHVEHLGQVRTHLRLGALCELQKALRVLQGADIGAEAGVGLENDCITSSIVLETGDSQHFNQLNEKTNVFSLFTVKKMYMII